MDQPYLRIRFQRPRSCGATLSVPGGLVRALEQGRLPADAEALVPEFETWVPVSQHPAVALLNLSHSREPEVQVATAEPPRADPVDNVLLNLDQVTVLASAQDQQRRIPSRNPGGRASQPAKVIVAGGELDAGDDPGASLWRRQLVAVQRWAAAL